jgi:hypothetical protein
VWLLFPLLLSLDPPVAAADYYLDAVNGSDTASGSAAGPWKTARNIVSYYAVEDRPTNWVRLLPGDTVWLKNGVYPFVDDIEVHHCVFRDNYDRQAADTGGHWTENSRHTVLFGGGSAAIHHCHFENTPPMTASITGTGIGYKHCSTVAGAVFEVHDNTFLRCAGYSVATGTA